MIDNQLLMRIAVALEKLVILECHKASGNLLPPEGLKRSVVEHNRMVNDQINIEMNHWTEE